MSKKVDVRFPSHHSPVWYRGWTCVFFLITVLCGIEGGRVFSFSSHNPVLQRVAGSFSSHILVLQRVGVRFPSHHTVLCVIEGGSALCVIEWFLLTKQTCIIEGRSVLFSHRVMYVVESAFRKERKKERRRRRRRHWFCGWGYEFLFIQSCMFEKEADFEYKDKDLSTSRLFYKSVPSSTQRERTTTTT